MRQFGIMNSVAQTQVRHPAALRGRLGRSLAPVGALSGVHVSTAATLAVALRPPAPRLSRYQASGPSPQAGVCVPASTLRGARHSLRHARCPPRRPLSASKYGHLTIEPAGAASEPKKCESRTAYRLRPASR